MPLHQAHAGNALDAQASVTAGDIFHASWGYDQTNCDFYQVLSATTRFAILRRLRNEIVEGGGWAGMAKPDKNAFADHEGPIRRKIQRLHDGSPAFVIARYANAYPWDGKPKPFTSYA
jgi:hypothetical protein